MINKFDAIKKTVLFFSIFLISKSGFTQNIKEIYCQLPSQYLEHCPIAVLFSKGDNGINRAKLNQLITLNLKDLNNKKSPDLGSSIQTKIIDNKNGYLKFCDGGCTWEFVMKLFDSKNTKQKYVAIWAGSNDGATTGTNKIFYFLQYTATNNKINFEDVTKEFRPELTYKEILTKEQQLKFKKALDKVGPTNLLETFEFFQYNKTAIKVITEGGDVFYLDDYGHDADALAKLLTKKEFLFKWTGNKFLLDQKSKINKK